MKRKTKIIAPAMDGSYLYRDTLNVLPRAIPNVVFTRVGETRSSVDAGQSDSVFDYLSKIFIGSSTEKA